MKIKKFAAVLAAAAMLTACGNVNEAAVSDISDTSEAVSSETEAITETESESASEEETVSETSEESETAAQAAADEQAGNYKAAYKTKLLEVLNDENASSPAFDLFDMDNDGIPELFVSIGDYHAAGVFAYTFKNGALADLSGENTAFGSYGEAAVSADGYLTGEYMGMGITYDSFYQLDGDKLVMISNVEMGEIPDGDDYENIITYYKVNDKDAAEEEYNKAFDEYNAHDWVTVGRGNLVSEETINSVLFDE